MLGNRGAAEVTQAVLEALSVDLKRRSAKHTRLSGRPLTFSRGAWDDVADPKCAAHFHTPGFQHKLTGSVSSELCCTCRVQVHSWSDFAEARTAIQFLCSLCLEAVLLVHGCG